MGACCGGEAVSEKYIDMPMTSKGKRGGSVTDLEELFKTWAWESYLRTASGRNKLSFKEAHIQLNWSGVKVKPETLQHNRFPDQAITSSQPRPQVIFASRYQNDTNVPQTHAFRTEKTTKATVTTAVTKGFSKGADLGLELSLPGDIAKATVGFGLNYTVDSADENTVEHAMTWTTDTTVTSEAKSVTLAELEIQEATSKWKFDVTVKIKGRITAVIRGVKGKTKVSMTITGDVATIISDKRDKNANSIPKEVEIKNGRVIWPVEGTCDFRFGVSQKVKVVPETMPRQ